MHAGPLKALGLGGFNPRPDGRGDVFLDDLSGRVVQSTPSRITITSQPQGTAGQPLSITVAAVDVAGNVVTDYAGTIHFSSSDDRGVLPNDYTFTPADAGVHTFDGVTLFQAGDQSIRGVDRVTGAAGSTTVTAMPAAADHFSLTTDDRVYSGTPFDIAVTALDPYGNVDTNYRGTVTFATSDTDERTVLALDYSFTREDAGTHMFTDTGRGETTLITEADQTVTAADLDNGFDGTVTVTVDPGGAAPHGGPWLLAPFGGEVRRTHGSYVVPIANAGRRPATPSEAAVGSVGRDATGDRFAPLDRPSMSIWSHENTKKEVVPYFQFCAKEVNQCFMCFYDGIGM